MRFRGSSGPTPYLNKRDQLRMLAMAGLLALVLIGMKMTSNPQFWHWLVPPETGEQPAETITDGPEQKQIDVGVRVEEEDTLLPDEFRSRAEPEPAPTPDDEDHAPETSPQETASGDADDPQTGEYETKIDAKRLESVRDDTINVRHAEAAAFYAILAKARDLPLERLERAARDDVKYDVLMANADHFRGTPITVAGEIKRLQEIPAGENEHGIETLYEAWLFTPDSGIKPYRIVCTGIPADIPRGKRIEGPVSVRVTGYFFKREGYPSEGGLNVAPTLLAQRLHWLRGKSAIAVPLKNDDFMLYFVGMGILAAAGLGLTVWRFTAGDKRFYRSRIKPLTTAPREAIDALADVETTDPSDMFRQLTEQAETSEVADAAEDLAAADADADAEEEKPNTEDG